MPNQPSKYHSKKTMIDNITFDSKKEAQRYQELKILQNQGIIKDLELQPKFELQVKFKTKDGQSIRAINYIADFRYFDSKINRIVVEDCKGFRTKDFNIKYKLFLYKYPEYVYLLH